jgi:hypothetical protein
MTFEWGGVGMMNNVSSSLETKKHLQLLLVSGTAVHAPSCRSSERHGSVMWAPSCELPANHLVALAHCNKPASPTSHAALPWRNVSTHHWQSRAAQV